MKTINTSGLATLGNEETGPWLMDDEHLLRTAWSKAPIRTLEQAQAVYDVYRAALGTGVRTPKPQEIVRVPGGFGVVVEYIPGINLGLHVAFGTFTPAEAGRALGTLARKMHAAKAQVGLDWQVWFRGFVRRLTGYLPAFALERLLTLVDAVPPSRTFLHGDLHPANVIVYRDELTVIDLEAVGFGHPVFDLAIMRARALGGPQGNLDIVARSDRYRQAADMLWRAILAGYFPDRDDEEVATIARGIELLSEVDRLVRDYRIPPRDEGAGSELSAERQAGIDACIERIGKLASSVEHLDFC